MTNNAALDLIDVSSPERSFFPYSSCWCVVPLRVFWRLISSASHSLPHVAEGNLRQMRHNFLKGSHTWNRTFPSWNHDDCGICHHKNNWRPNIIHSFVICEHHLLLNQLSSEIEWITSKIQNTPERKMNVKFLKCLWDVSFCSNSKQITTTQTTWSTRNKFHLHALWKWCWIGNWFSFDWWQVVCAVVHSVRCVTPSRWLMDWH